MKDKIKLALISVKQSDGFPPSGLVYVSTYLKKHLGSDIQVKIIDENYDDARKEVRRGNFDLIGISAMCIYYGRALRLAYDIKKERNIPIIIGGVHISTLPDSFEGCFDLGVMGEGEEPMLELVKLYSDKGALNKADLLKIKGIIFLDGGKLIKTEERPLIGNLDDIPLPDWRLANRGYFSNTALNTWGEFGVEGNVLTSRGCPYKCLFCSTTQFWQKMRFHSPEYVIEQIRDLADNYKVTHIQIWDDLFTINKPRLLKIGELLRKSGLLVRIKFNCQPRPNLLDDELCKILKELNIKIGIFGFETGSENVLKFLKRGTVTVEDNKRAILLCKKYEIKVQGSVVLGSPGETIEDMRKTLDFVDFAIKNKVQRLWSFVLTPYPGTQIWDIAKERGRVKDKGFDWDLLSLQNTDKPLLLDEDVNLAEFKRIFLAIRKKLIRSRWKKITSFFLDNPFRTLAYALKNPFYGIYLLFTKNDV